MSYQALIFGSTGSTGRDLVDHLIASKNWKKVHCVVRKSMDHWKQAKYKDKLSIQVQQNMDELLRQEWKFEGYDAVFVCFGSQVKHGEQTFRKIDKDYPLAISNIAFKCDIPHYLIVTSEIADQNSMLLYVKVKGEVQKELLKSKVKMVSILKPGLIANRHDARFGEKLINCLSGCCIRKIQNIDLAQSMMLIAEQRIQNPKQGIQNYVNNRLLEIVQNQSKSK